MPSNLTPEQLARLRALMSPTGSGWVNPYQEMDGNIRVQPLYEQGQGQDGVGNYGPVTGYQRYDTTAQNPGNSYDMLDATGQFTKSGEFTDEPGLIEGMLKDPLFYSFLAAAGGLGAGLAGGGSAFGGGAGAGAGAGTEAMSLFDLGGNMAGGAGAAGAGGAGAGALGTMGSLSPMSTAGLEALTPMATGSGMFSGLLGPAATLLGGLAGAQGQDNSQTQTKQMPEWLKKYYDNGQGGGVLPAGMGLLASQMTPERTAQMDQLRAAGAMGLLNTPMKRTFAYGSR